MPHPAHIQLALLSDEQSRSAQAQRRQAMDELDTELQAALLRIEAKLNGQDVHKVLAEKMTDDPQHPVSVTQVHDWISRRNGRRPPEDLTDIVADMDERFNAFRNERNNYEAPKRKELIPLEVRHQRALQKLRRLGEVGEQIIRELGEPVPREVQDWEKSAPAPKGAQ